MSVRIVIVTEHKLVTMSLLGSMKEKIAHTGKRQFDWLHFNILTISCVFHMDDIKLTPSLSTMYLLNRVSL